MASDLSHLCGASTSHAGSTLGPCILRAGHPGPVHQDTEGVRWAATVTLHAPAATVHPDEVPDEWVALASEAYRTAPQKRDGKPTSMRHALAAVIPAIRAQIADEITAKASDHGGIWQWEAGMLTAARIARGEDLPGPSGETGA